MATHGETGEHTQDHGIVHMLMVGEEHGMELEDALMDMIKE